MTDKQKAVAVIDSIDGKLAEQISEQTGKSVFECYQCEKCSAGCPMADDMDIPPHKVIRLVQFGEEKTLLACDGIWKCIGCEACAARCPNLISAAKINDALRQLVVARGLKPAVPNVRHFHDTFVESVGKTGRLHEVGMISAYKMRSGEFTKDMKLGLDLFGRGKIKLKPTGVKRKEEIRRLFDAAAKKGGHK